MSLKELLGEELYSQVQEKLDDDTELIINDGNYIPRSRLNDKNDKMEMLEGQVEDVKSQLDERDTQLEQLKNDTQASDELKSRIEELENQNNQQKEEYETKIQEQDQEYQTKIEQQQFNSKLDLSLRDAQAKNPKAVKALLNSEEIKLDGDKLLGLEDQIKILKESDSYLFGEERIKGNPPNKGGGNPTPKPDPEEMTDEEYIKWREENEPQ
jgi:chromosome segregation ATPase